MVDIASTIMESTVASDLNQRIAERVRELRAGQSLSLEALANKSGVSRSMISVIERGESSPTAVVLEKLAAGLGVTLASLFDAPAASAPGGPVARREDQPQWRDPASGYLRRNVSPPGVPQPMRIVECASTSWTSLRNNPGPTSATATSSWSRAPCISGGLSDPRRNTRL